MIEKEFNPDGLYSRIVHYYMDRKGYGKARANAIAQHVVKKETERRICKTSGCGHFLHDHIRNTGVCLSVDCACEKFTRPNSTEKDQYTKGESMHAGRKISTEQVAN